MMRSRLTKSGLLALGVVASTACAPSLRGADLHDANLQDADLQSADMRDANLRGVNFHGANLQSADLRGADLRGALVADGVETCTPGVGVFPTCPRFGNVSHYCTPALCTHPPAADVDGARWDGATCPDGTPADESGATCEGHLSNIPAQLPR